MSDHGERRSTHHTSDDGVPRETEEPVDRFGEWTAAEQELLLQEAQNDDSLNRELDTLVKEAEEEESREVVRLRAEIDALRQELQRKQQLIRRFLERQRILDERKDRQRNEEISQLKDYIEKLEQRLREQGPSNDGDDCDAARSCDDAPGRYELPRTLSSLMEEGTRIFGAANDWSREHADIPGVEEMMRPLLWWFLRLEEAIRPRPGEEVHS